MEKTVKYIQLEPSAFLTDIDFQMMNAEQRGVYCSIIFYLYCNRGELELTCNGDITLLSNKFSRLAIISGCQKTGAEWDNIWAKIADKFKITGNILTHKRVTEELQKAADYIKQKSDAGKKGMESRYADNTVITKEKKSKVSKRKVSKVKLKPPTLAEVQNYIKEKGYNVEAKRFFEYFNESGWVDSTGKKVRSWKQKIITWSNHNGTQNNRTHSGRNSRSLRDQESAIGETIDS